MKSVFLAGSCLLLSFSVLAQSEEVSLPSKQVVIHGISGFSFPALGDLSTELKKAGLLDMSTAYFHRGAGVFVCFNKVRLATITHFTTYSATKEENGKSSAVRGTQVGSALGVLLLRKKMQVMPYAGFAYSLFGVRSAITNPAGGTAFGSYLSGVANMNHISTNQWMGHIGFQLGKMGTGSSKLGRKIVLAVRAGYYIPFSHAKWKTNDTQLSSGPGANPGNFYTSFILGLIQ